MNSSNYMYKIGYTPTVSSSIVKSVVAVSAVLPILMNAAFTRDTNEVSDMSVAVVGSSTYTHPFSERINVSPPIHRPIARNLIRLKERIEQFVNNTKVETAYVTILHKSINDSLQFLTHFPHELPLPSAHYAEDGEIILEWFFNNKSVVLSITGDGYYGYAMLKNGKYVAGQSDGNINSVITAELYAYLQS